MPWRAHADVASAHTSFEILARELAVRPLEAMLLERLAPAIGLPSADVGRGMLRALAEELPLAA